MPEALPQEVQDAAVELRRSGWSLSQIAKHLGISKASAGRYVKGIEAGEGASLPSQSGERPKARPVPVAQACAALGPDVDALWRRLKTELERHPAVADADWLPQRLARLIDRTIGVIDSKLDTASLRDAVGALKIASDVLDKLLDRLQGAVPRPVDVRVHQYDEIPEDELDGLIRDRVRDLARLRGLDLEGTLRGVVAGELPARGGGNGKG